MLEKSSGVIIFMWLDLRAAISLQMSDSHDAEEKHELDFDRWKHRL